MQRHIIVELLGIKDKQVDVWNIEEEGSALRVELYTRQRQQKCPFCKEKTKHVHGYRNQAIQGSAFVLLSLRKRRYLCTSCVRTFYERLQIVEFYQRCTSTLKTTVLTYTAFHSFTTAARCMHERTGWMNGLRQMMRRQPEEGWKNV